MDTEKNNALIRETIEEVWNRGDADAIERYDAPHLQDEIKRHHAELMEAFTDVHVEGSWSSSARSARSEPTSTGQTTRPLE